MPKVCSVSIDIDTLRYYHQIHGLSLPPDDRPDPVYTHALPRFLKVFRAANLRATLFVIAQDLDIPEHEAILREAVAQGHELANHTYHHPYNLTRLADHEVEAEIARADERIADLLPDDKQVVGFRCPGYNISPQVLWTLRQRGYRYDSSIFPCLPYYSAKALVMGWLALKGTPSRSILGSPRVLLAPTHPYLPADDPHKAAQHASTVFQHRPLPDTFPNAYQRAEGTDLLEIPMALIPGARLPYIGTSMLLYPSRALLPLTKLVAQTYPLLNIELHAIDFLDPKRDPGLDALTQHQPDLRVDLIEKHQRFSNAFQQIGTTHKYIPLAEATAFLNP